MENPKEETPKKRKAGNPNWYRGMPAPNQHGRPKKPDLVKIKKLERLTRVVAQKAISKWINKPMIELKIALQDPNTESLDCMIISTILFTIKKGDPRRLDWIFTQLLGRIPITVHDETTDGRIEKRILLELPKSGRIKEKSESKET